MKQELFRKVDNGLLFNIFPKLEVSDVRDLKTLECPAYFCVHMYILGYLVFVYAESKARDWIFRGYILDQYIPN